MRQRLFTVAAFTVASLFAAGIASAQPSDASSSQSKIIASGAPIAEVQAKSPGDPIPGRGLHRHDTSTTAGGVVATDLDDTGDGGEAQQRKKMKKLKPAEAEPLELMDETDPCPTLPCP